MRIITAYISLIGNICLLGLSLFLAVYESNFKQHPGQIFVLSGAVLLTVSTIYALISGKFYRKSEAEKIKEENRVLKLKVEQVQLKKSLKNE